MDFDYIVIGSGFGGSVSALRLSQEGYRVAVIEEGRRFGADDFPESTWQSSKYHWLPGLGCHGIQRMDVLKHALVVGGAGVGGGSLVYGNALFEPLPTFFELAEIRRLGGAETLKPYYELARKMMGVVANPRLFEPDRILRETAQEYGREDTFTPSPVGVYFGDPEKLAADPYFGGQGPARQGCTFCGGCFVGCRHRAKNSLDHNYLYLAERLGAKVMAETRVAAIEPLSADGYLLHTRRSTKLGGRPRRLLRARAVIVAAGVMGTLRLLLESKQRGHLPRLSSRLGHDVRTNSEAILGVMSRDRSVDFSQGIAASSSVFPDEHTQVQADRHPAGSDTLGLLSTLLVDGGGKIPRPLRFLTAGARRPLDMARATFPTDFAKRSIVLVVMQDLESSLRIVARRPWYRPTGYSLFSEQQGEGVPAYIPMANDFARRMARRLNGVPLSSVSEVFWDAPTTAHILGGCVIGEDSGQGVIDGRHQAFGYRNLLVVDGSVIPVNLGVNPALSILAFAERAMSFIPIRDGDPASMQYLKVDEQWQVQELL